MPETAELARQIRSRDGDWILETEIGVISSAQSFWLRELAVLAPEIEDVAIAAVEKKKLRVLIALCFSIMN